MLLAACGIALPAQNVTDSGLHEAVRAYFAAYRLPGYVPFSAMRADSLRVDDEARTVSVYANEAFASQPFTPAGVRAIVRDLGRRLPPPYDTYRLDVCGRDGMPIEELIPNRLREGNVDESRLWGDTDYTGRPWVTNVSRPYVVTGGLAGRHIAVAPSHGRYYKYGAWRWQRPYLFCTTEDLFTQSFVLPYLLPMLENAGAVVLCPRERDVQTSEAVVDNDAPQRMGEYAETGLPDSEWASAGDSSGFAPPAGLLTDSVGPFRCGTARVVKATSRESRTVSASWTPRLPRAGRYAVYVSYLSLPNSVDDALYTVCHRGGRTQFRVNQRMGGGTWVYLGTFDFDEGTGRDARVVLTNLSDRRGVVTADAVRFGGGVGQTERGTAGTSGLPRFLEGARYYAQWAGVPDTLRLSEDGNNDYNEDIRARTTAVNFFGGGSPYLPGAAGGQVPLELSLAVHSDAGTRADNTVYGSLAICTTRDNEGSGRYPSGLSRRASADFADLLLSTAVRDLSAVCREPWTRRELWDRNYGESRSAGVPSAIFEMLSHQNFIDMKFGHDPHFKFAMSRAIYKSVLRFVNFEHGVRDYAVQPLPVHAFSALLTPEGDAVRLSWAATADTLEPTAAPTAYVVYTKTDDGGFDNGRAVRGATSLVLPVAEGRQYSFKVTAVNAGGESFPSETLSVCRAPGARKSVLVVNGFDRLSGPARIDTPDSLGFDLKTDIGVPYGYTAAYAGAQLNFDRTAAGREGPAALGYCGSELVGKVIAGNTFDYPEAHGRDIRTAGGFSFSSVSRDALLSGAVEPGRYDVVDYICGLERDVPHNLRPCKSLPPAVCRVLKTYLDGGGSLLLSGAYVASDMDGSAEERDFTSGVLKYRCGGTDTYAPCDSLPAPPASVRGLNLEIPLCRTYNRDHYAAVTTDVVEPASPDAFAAFAYPSGRSAGIAYRGPRYRVIATGFPFECISDAGIRSKAMGAVLRFLTE